jgi:hypothetical protein
LSGAAVHRLTARILVVVPVLGALALAPYARAAEVTRVRSALDDDNAFDFDLTLDWVHEQKSAFVKRESTDNGGNLVKDLQFGQTRDILNMRMDFGILWDVGIHVGAPLVLADNRHLDFDQSAGSACTFPGESPNPTCVNQQNSTILSSGILPSSPSSWGLNSKNGQPFTSGSRVFQGPTRSGFESLNLGITWAAFNQRRDDTRPTWTLNFEALLDVFSDMRYDPSNPNGNTATGLGYHQFVWSTYVSKRFRYFDPYFGAWYMLPVRTNGSIYQNIQNGNMTAVNPMQRAGVTGGFEQIAWENPRADQRVTVEFQARAEEHFYGRSATEIWEPLAGSSKCMAPNTPECRPGIDYNIGDTLMTSPYPGVTDTQAYGTFGGALGLNVQVGKYTRFRGLFGLVIDEPHYITYSGTGVDRNGDGRVDSTQGSNEANVLYRDSIDAPGRRFKVEGTQVWSLLLEGSMMF